mmetsp:Transcript_31796/g.82667  ORF Transcript_31796/g.82667 Transcript_31796/m.82667 type:complete len:186 (+) Transcript_31796:455-1012(+)
MEQLASTTTEDIPAPPERHETPFMHAWALAHGATEVLLLSPPLPPYDIGHIVMTFTCPEILLLKRMKLAIHLINRELIMTGSKAPIEKPNPPPCLAGHRLLIYYNKAHSNYLVIATTTLSHTHTHTHTHMAKPHGNRQLSAHTTICSAILHPPLFTNLHRALTPPAGPTSNVLADLPGTADHPPG